MEKMERVRFQPRGDSSEETRLCQSSRRAKRHPTSGTIDAWVDRVSEQKPVNEPDCTYPDNREHVCLYRNVRAVFTDKLETTRCTEGILPRRVIGF